MYSCVIGSQDLIFSLAGVPELWAAVHLADKNSPCPFCGQIQEYPRNSKRHYKVCGKSYVVSIQSTILSDTGLHFLSRSVLVNFKIL